VLLPNTSRTAASAVWQVMTTSAPCAASSAVGLLPKRPAEQD
jgi:hypothetical protein